MTTHDLPPTAGYLGLEHVAIRQRLGLLTRSVEEEREAELGAIGHVRSALVLRGLLEPEASQEDLLVALHAWLGQTPSRMLVVGLSDLVGDRRAVNQPGTLDEYPNWRVPLTDAAGRLVRLEDVTAAVRRAGGPDLRRPRHPLTSSGLTLLSGSGCSPSESHNNGSLEVEGA